MARILRKVATRCLVFLLPCAVLPLFLHAQVAYAANNNQEVHHYAEVTANRPGTIKLKSLLEQLHQRYRLSFVYDDQVIENTKLPAVVLQDKPDQIIQVLAKYLQKENLKLTPIGAGQYGITRDQPELRRGREAEVPNQNHVSGIVKDKLGNPLVGVTIKVQGTSQGTVTNAEGRFTLDVEPADSLEISYIGYQQQVIGVRNRSEIDVTMEANVGSLNEVVVVAYGQQKKATVTGAISSISGAELKQSPAANLAVSLAGRLPGLTAIQTSGEPGRDATLMYLRGQGTVNGQNPIILVDGIPRDLTYIDPSEVASVTILKDASATAMYGIKGANGVILVTTKRGKNEKPQINFTAETGIQGFTTLPSTVNSYQYVNLRNQAGVNDGLGEYYFYSKEAVEHYKLGDDPLRYPYNDWTKILMHKFTPQTRYDLNLTGGNGSMSYFVNAGYLHQGGMWKVDQKKYDPSLYLNRYNFRSNIDLYLNKSKSLKAFLNVAGYLEKVNEPGLAVAYPTSLKTFLLLSYVFSTPPNLGGPLTPDGQVVSSGAYHSAYGAINRSGYTQETRSNVTSSFGMEQKLDFITPGLSAKFMMSFDTHTIYDLNATQNYEQWKQIVDPNLQGVDGKDSVYYQKSTADQNTPLSTSTSTSFESYSNIQVFVNYDHAFGKNAVSGLLLAQKSKTITPGDRIPFNLLGLSGRVTYGYDNRYFAEFDAGYNGSEQFAKGNRFGFFPAISGAWLISNERFLKNNRILSLLKLRASYGKVGNDQLGGRRFLYLDDISIGGGGWSGNVGRGQTVNETSLGNPNLSWEVAEKTNFGIDIGLFDQLSLTVDVFKEKRDNILINPQTIPQLNGFPGGLPPLNVGRMKNHGYEIQLDYNKYINKDWAVVAKLNFNRAKNTVEYIDEAEKPADYAYRYRQTGYSFGQAFGYVADGYWNSQDEIDKSKLTFVGVQPRPGDLKFKDVNGDGVIDERDEAPVGYTNVPQYTYGAAFSINYKHFDVSFLFQGVFKVSNYFTGWGVYENNNNIPLYRSRMLEAWTPERVKEGLPIKFPALSTGTSRSESVTNSFFLENTSYLRLKNAEIGYTLPLRLSQKIGANKIRFYTNGLDILTWDRMHNTDFDPELEEHAGLTYPIEKIFNFGVNVVF
ncbi:MAG TPA: TonB-dependent receptor [Chitinophagaceae bacterium]|nr:TonB-dependent receptor [Chitinophagaceae bacterium]